MLNFDRALDDAGRWAPDGGGPFHAFDLFEGRCAVEHRCRDDLYRGAFEVEGQDLWTAVWRVSGPRKAQVLTNRHARSA